VPRLASYIAGFCFFIYYCKKKWKWGSAGQLALTVLERIMEGLQHQGRPIRQWIHNIEEWTGCEYIQLKEMSQDRAQWRRKILEWSSRKVD